MNTLVFKTPGLLDLRALTTFGVNSKPKSANPIGYFGTGLKYAIAVLARLQCDTTIFIGSEAYTLEMLPEQFRDKEFGFLALRHSNSVLTEKIDLPYTTELGKDWQPWQIFRELYANTIDEHGETFLSEKRVGGADGCTKIVISGAEMVKEYEEREKTFLPEANQTQSYAEPVQIFDRPSNHIYYRGLRVLDLKDPAALTYNIRSKLDLTEDRTAKSSWEVHYCIKEFLMACQDKEIIAKALNGIYERDLNFAYESTKPSAAFIDAVVTAKPKNMSAANYVLAHAPKTTPATKPLSERLQAWIDTGTLDQHPGLVDLLKEAVGELNGSPF